MSRSLQRFGAMMRKEMIQRLRDRRTLALILSIPLIQLFLFAYAVDLTADHLPTAVADMSRDARSRAFLDALVVSGYFDVALYVEDEAAAIRAIDEGHARAAIVIPPGFAAQIERGDAQALIILDGSDSFSVQSGYSAATAVAQAHALELAARIQKHGAKHRLSETAGGGVLLARVVRAEQQREARAGTVAAAVAERER